MKRPNASLLFVACLAHAQSADKNLTFDVASIKPVVTPTAITGGGRGMVMMRGPTGGPGSKDPGRIHYPFMSLKNLLMNAYDLKNFQVSGPGWLDTERFDIEATMPPETTKEQFRIMLQNLLAERFLLTIHRETKDLPMYTLVVAKNGPKMKESVETPVAAEPSDAPPPGAMLAGPGPLKMGADGFPIFPPTPGGRGGMSQMMMPNRARIIASKQTMQDLATRLTEMLNRPVTEATGLTAKFDFTLTYSPEGLNRGMLPPLPPPPPGGAGAGAATSSDIETPPDLFSAIQSQLGLKLDAKKGPVAMIVVDHIEKTPTGN